MQDYKQVLIRLAVLMGCALQVLAQTPVTGEANGFHLYNVATSMGYSSGVNDFLPVQVGQSASDLMGIVSTTVGYSRGGADSGMSLVYTPSYVRTRTSLLRAFSQNLSLSSHVRLNQKWNAFFGASALDTSLDQLLLAPGSLGQTANAVANGQQDVSTVSVQPGSLTDSISRGLVYGDRLFGADAHAGLVYNYSTRLTVTFTLGMTHAQSRTDASQPQTVQREALIPRTTAGEGGVAVSYYLTPRMQVGAEASSVRVFAGPSNYYITRTTGSFGRHFTRRWFASLHAGTGVITPLDQSQPYAAKPALTYSVSTGYLYGASTFLGTYSRMVGDLYGFGAASTDGVSGVWDWRKPRHRWGFNVSGGREQIRRNLDIVSWQMAGGLTCQASRDTLVTFAFAYLSSTGAPFVTQPNLSGWSGRVTFVFTPHGRWATVTR